MLISLRPLVNIWTHLVGALLFLGFLLHFSDSVRLNYHTAALGDIIAILIFDSAVAVCFVLSTSFHTFSDHSPEMHTFGNELDHLGVVFVIWGSGIPSSYFGFYCSPHIQILYCLLITCVALACATFTLRPEFRVPTYRTVRFLMYCFLGLSLFIPAVHGIWTNGWSSQNERMGLTYFISLGALNFSGAAIYAARVPERWVPKTFDIWGSSHQIMHVLVVCGALSHLRGLMKVFEYWNEEKIHLCASVG